MNLFYKSVGISKQVVHQYARRQVEFDQKVEQLIIEAEELRDDHPFLTTIPNIGFHHNSQKFYFIETVD